MSHATKLHGPEREPPVFRSNSLGLAGVEARLDRLSLQMDLCLSEITSWRLGP